MKLFIDTSDADQIVIGLGKDRFTTNAKKDKAQILLPFIDEKLSDMKKTINDITEIEVFDGPGSYTGLRVGVSVAQTIGFVLAVPVNGKIIRNGESIEIKYER